MTCFISYKEKQNEIYPPPHLNLVPKKGGIHSTEIITLKAVLLSIMHIYFSEINNPSETITWISFMYVC
jgi:hypothetical protein